jgi:hypothetical protein
LPAHALKHNWTLVVQRLPYVAPISYQSGNM